jgi:hypothetical protein
VEFLGVRENVVLARGLPTIHGPCHRLLTVKRSKRKGRAGLSRPKQPPKYSVQQPSSERTGGTRRAKHHRVENAKLRAKEPSRLRCSATQIGKSALAKSREIATCETIERPANVSAMAIRPIAAGRIDQSRRIETNHFRRSGCGRA